jgi:hypothetical protein
MPELPDRPDLDQLRRQARELLRAATEGEPHALTRLRQVSERVTLSSAQLTLAREYGFPSWPALRTEAERRRRLSEPSARPSSGDMNAPHTGALEDRRSFGGATAIKTAAGMLSPRVLVIGPDHAVLDASLMPSEGTPRQHAAPPGPGESTRERRFKAAGSTPMVLAQTAINDITVTDDRGTRYTLHTAGMAGSSGRPDQARGPIMLDLRLDPVPARECGWIELHSQDGSATRLLPSARPAVRVGQLGPASRSPAERQLWDQALWLIELQLAGTGQDAEDQDHLRRRCSAALATAAEIRQSGELDPGSVLPDQIARLCASLAGHHLAEGLPPGWSGMLNAAQRTDGPRHHLDIAAALPPVDDTVVQVDSLVSEPESWRVYLAASPGWWTYSADHRRKWAVMSVDAEDNLGGMYLSIFNGSTGHGDHEELTLRFLPRLDPRARALTLTFTATAEQVAVELRLVPAAKSSLQ